jgi:hypothetical protein
MISVIIIYTSESKRRLSIIGWNILIECMKIRERLLRKIGQCIYSQCLA